MKKLFCLLILLSVLQVAAASAAQQPMVRASISPEEVMVGSEVTLTVTLLVPTWLPKPPAFPTMELEGVVGVEPPDSSFSTSEVHAGVTWSGLIKEYKLYPLEVGNFALQDKQIGITYADPKTVKPVHVRVPLPELKFSAVVPAGAQDLEPFLAGSSLELVQELSPQADSYNPGDALERRLTARLEGMQSLFIPPLISLQETAGLAVYPGSASTEDVYEKEKKTVTGVRNEIVTYVFERGGTYQLPPVTLRWWNTGTKSVETAELPAIEFQVTGAVAQGKTLAESLADLPRSLILTVLLVGVGAVLALYYFRKLVLGRLVAGWHNFFASELYASWVTIIHVLFRNPASVYSSLLAWQRAHVRRTSSRRTTLYGDSFWILEEKLYGPDSRKGPVGLPLRVKLISELLALRSSTPSAQGKGEPGIGNINPH